MSVSVNIYLYKTITNYIKLYIKLRSLGRHHMIEDTPPHVSYTPPHTSTRQLHTVSSPGHGGVQGLVASGELGHVPQVPQIQKVPWVQEVQADDLSWRWAT